MEAMPTALRHLQRVTRHARWRAPTFAVRAEQVELLDGPQAFQEAVVRGVKRAETRVAVASLYVGTESKLVDEVYRALEQRTKECSKLDVAVLVDGWRATRPTRDEDGRWTSTAQKLAEHLQPKPWNKKPRNVRVGLYQTPAMRGLARKLLPPKYKEVVGVHHVKAFVFDDDVLITGANLSHDYFTARQDRYLHLRKAKPVADHMAKLLEAVMDLSYPLQADGSLGNVPCGIDPHLQPKEFKNRFYDTVGAVTTAQGPAPEHAYDADTYVIPTFQMGQFGLLQDEEYTKAVISMAEPGSQLRLASAYLNLAKSYELCMAKAVHDGVDLSFLTASPQANGFFGAKGPAGYIPRAYSILEERLYQRLKCRIWEYNRPGWQFHGKGLWYIPPKQSTPVLTSIGSPNFGYRSIRRDMECQLYLFTGNVNLRNTLHDEMEHLHQHAKIIDPTDFQHEGRRSGPMARAAMNLIRHYL